MKRIMIYAAAVLVCLMISSCAESQQASELKKRDFEETVVGTLERVRFSFLADRNIGGFKTEAKNNTTKYTRHNLRYTLEETEDGSIKAVTVFVNHVDVKEFADLGPSEISLLLRNAVPDTENEKENALCAAWYFAMVTKFCSEVYGDEDPFDMVFDIRNGTVTDRGWEYSIVTNESGSSVTMKAVYVG